METTQLVRLSITISSDDSAGRISRKYIEVKEKPNTYQTVDTENTLYTKHIKKRELGEIKTITNNKISNGRGIYHYAVLCLPEDQFDMFTKLRDYVTNAITADIEAANRIQTTVNRLKEHNLSFDEK